LVLLLLIGGRLAHRAALARGKGGCGGSCCHSRV